MLTRYSRRLNAKFGVVAQAFASANRKPFT
jgi:hypothetical protein